MLTPGTTAVGSPSLPPLMVTISVVLQVSDRIQASLAREHLAYAPPCIQDANNFVWRCQVAPATSFDAVKQKLCRDLCLPVDQCQLKRVRPGLSADFDQRV